MLFRYLLSAVALATGAAATSLSDTLASQKETLSTLSHLLGSQPDLVHALDSASNITLLAPGNDAFTNFLNTGGSVDGDPGQLAALLSYHVLAGTWFASSFTSASVFVPTWLSNETYANVTGGQVVEAAAVAGTGNITFWSGFRQNATVTRADLNFTGGTVQIVDAVLTIPADLGTTLVQTSLAAADGALQKAGNGLAGTLGQLRSATVFAPSNGAFAAVANLAANWTDDQLAAILEYHVLAEGGAVDYSTRLKNGTQAATLGGGGKVTFTVGGDGDLFVNAARVVERDVLISNGVLHVIDNVLNPQNATARPDTAAATEAPAFAGATADPDDVPFTSGVPAPTTFVPAATSTAAAPSSSTSSGLAMPAQTGAVGYAALFGGAAILANL